MDAFWWQLNEKLAKKTLSIRDSTAVTYGLVQKVTGHMGSWPSLGLMGQNELKVPTEFLS